ncbi:acyl-CoA dehydrogenase family protein [Verticiella sediminum]
MECDPAVVRDAERNESGYSASLWKTFAALGWLGLSLPERYGGQALPLTYAALLFEELGRHIAPLPVLSTLVPALLIEKYGNASHKAVLSAVVSGEMILSFAVQEQSGRWSPEGIAMTAQRDGDALVLSGRKCFVADFQNATHCLTAVRVEEAGRAPGLALVLVDTAAPGIQVERLRPLAKDQECCVAFERVRVPAERLLGAGQAALDDLMDYAAVFTACQMQGAARKATELAAAYVTQREAFGQPIGAFQAIQHLAADMLNAVDGVQLLSREAVWRLSQGLPARIEVAQAKSFANEKCLMACRSAQQMHGGIGFMAEFDINLWYRRTASWGLRAGSTYEHRRLISRALLDTPGPVRLGVAAHASA